MPTAEFRIYGKVQGVFYRASAREVAAALGLTGWVRNLPDGSVLLRASGPEDLLHKMEQWCAKGPDGAEVQRVLRTNLPEEKFSDFSIQR